MFIFTDMTLLRAARNECILRYTRSSSPRAFGQVVSETAPGVVLLPGYTGKLLDPETGLQYNINRWYDASVGRWMSTDPIGFEAADANLYRYVGNGVVWQLDPSGLEMVGTGVKFCAGYQKGAVFVGNIMGLPTHWFMGIDGVGYGKFEEGLNCMGHGVIRDDEFNIYPERHIDDTPEGEFFSICYEVIIDGDCYDTNVFKDMARQFANFDPGPYVAIGANCRDWVFDAVYYALEHSRSTENEWWHLCKCACVYASERGVIQAR